MIPLLLLLALVTLCWSALFSGMETGLYSLNKLRLELRALRGERTDRSIQALLADGSTFMTLFLVGNNLVNDVLTLLGETILSRVYRGEYLEVLTAAAVMPVLLILGEAIPKGVFHAHAESLVRLGWPVISLARRLLLPLVLPLRPVAAFLARGAAQGGASGFAGSQGPQALALLLAEGGGAVSRIQRGIAANVAGLASLRVRVAMVPMSRVETVAAARTVGEALSQMASSEHGQFPVVGAHPGDVRGYVRLLDLLYTDRKDATVAEFALAVPRLPESLGIADALARMAASRARLGLVVSAAGKPLGIVTHKDLVEEIVGELRGF